jgi:hypothetical protein
MLFAAVWFLTSTSTIRYRWHRTMRTITQSPFISLLLFFLSPDLHFATSQIVPQNLVLHITSISVISSDIHCLVNCPFIASGLSLFIDGFVKSMNFVFFNFIAADTNYNLVPICTSFETFSFGFVHCEMVEN